jgi:CRISPR-associated protein Cmr6
MICGRRQTIANLQPDKSTHAGLWHDVYVPMFRAAEGASNAQGQDNPGEALRRHLEEVAKFEVPEGYKSAFEAREKLLRGLRGGVVDGVTLCYTATVKGRMVTGLGAASVTENQVALLRAWGVPYIPGSALKGLASSTAHRFGGEAWRRAKVDTPPGADAGVLFGSTEWQGVVIFHDAWWIPEDTKLPLDLDVMTVHHPEYYGKGDAPADWDEPNPVPFLTVHGSYLVALTGPRDWIELAAQWLKYGLAHDGIGAKTHAGYGRMDFDARLSEEEKANKRFMDEVANLPAQHKGASTASQHLDKLREALEKDPTRAKQIARTLYDKDPEFWNGWGKNPKCTDIQRDTMAKLEMLPSLSASITAPAVAPKKAEAPAEEAPREVRGWLPAEAWITGTGKGAMLHVRVGETPYKRPLNEFNLKKDLQEALHAAREDAPVPVEAEVKEGKGLLKVRARQSRSS